MKICIVHLGVLKKTKCNNIDCIKNGFTSICGVLHVAKKMEMASHQLRQYQKINISFDMFMRKTLF